MLSRIEPTAPPVEMPKEWVEEVEKLLNSVYAAQLKSQNTKFEILARSYSEEMILAVSYLEIDNPATIPVTYISSVDNKDMKTEQIKELLNIMVDSVGVFFDSYFSQPDWNEYNTTWQEANFKNKKVFYMVTRENLGLMLAADELLKNSLN